MNLEHRLPFLVIVLLFLHACKTKEAAIPAKPLTREEMILKNIDSLKSLAQSCDIIVREGDDMVSEHIRYLNENDKTYSHAGMIIEKNGKKYACHIAPGKPPSDTIQFAPIDSFIDPKKNIKVALYRFELSAQEKDSITALINSYKKNDVRFDMRYDLNTTDKMYCTEMIYRVLKQATGSRIEPKLAGIPQRMHKVLLKYFEKEKFTNDYISNLNIVTIDNVYLSTHASQIIAFTVKYFPGQ